jgi:beta-N-acetylhexosaminidase
MKRKAVIFGLKGFKLSNQESKLISKQKPWGIILFSRNVKDLNQLKILIKKIKKAANDKNYPIIIDQEGGRVSRLNKIIDLSLFTQEYFGRLFKLDKKNFYKKYEVYINAVCAILNEVGININTTPVLDVRREKSHNIVGDRSFSSDPNVVSKLGKLCIKFYEKNKVASIVKHIPGHGLAKSDSHFKLPIIYAKKKDLIKYDFKPFKFCNSLFAMTAHVLLKKYDSVNSVTHSKIIINNVIRKHIGFKGILISDDISMKALNNDIYKNATKALDAGCNIVLHCSGNIGEMNKLSKILPTIDKFTQKKTSHFYKFLG